MLWLLAWWRQIRGYEAPDPWEADTHIRAERASQHARIDAATRIHIQDGIALRREREFWTKHGDHHGGQPHHD